MPEAPETDEKPIALVGLPGAGKSTLGPLLAERLGLPFFDTDAEIEAATGMRVAELFEREGEAVFRTVERFTVAALVAEPAVIATGGGAFIDEANRGLMLERCIVVWLDGDVEVFARRAEQSGGRPLLNGEAALDRLAASRNPIYAEAHLRMLSDEAPAAVAARIAAALGR